jgi:hypothetical protein
MEALMGKSSINGPSIPWLPEGTSIYQLVCANIYQAATFAQEKWLRERRPQLVDLAQVGDREENVELVVPTSDVSIMWHIMKDDVNPLDLVPTPFLDQLCLLFFLKPIDIH